MRAAADDFVKHDQICLSSKCGSAKGDLSIGGSAQNYQLNYPLKKAAVKRSSLKKSSQKTSLKKCPLKFCTLKICPSRHSLAAKPAAGFSLGDRPGKRAGAKISSLLVWAMLAFSILAWPALAYDVIAGGQSLGIVLKSQGAVVVGFTPVIDAGGAEVYPARDAGVETDDVLVAINGRQVSSNQEVAELINRLGRLGEPVELTLLRDGKTRQLDVQPVLCAESGQWRIGLYIRDANAGIGTLTFYDEANSSFAALGHRIAENSAYEGGGEPIGWVLAAQVQYIQNSVEGEPGEKVGVFDKEKLNGEILKNCELGIYGTLEQPVANPLYPQPLEVAEASEVEPGPATILTVLEGERLEEFAIEIERVMPQKRAADKGMVIRVTDERLLARAGGIVQGMSGSPIIQNGRLVGAVTHVFVNDTCTGYGCFAEWMLEEARQLQGI